MDEDIGAAHVVGERSEALGIDPRRVHLLRSEADHDLGLVDVEVVGALADGHRHSTPVGIGAVDCGLDQRRVDDRLGHSLCLRRIAGLVDRHFDEFRRPLAVAGDLLGEMEGDLGQRGFEGGEINRARGPVGQNYGGVGG